MGNDNRRSIKQVAKDLIKEDGWKGLYRGFGPRFFSMSAWGTSMILTYEYLSKISSFCGLDFFLCLYLHRCFVYAICLRLTFIRGTTGVRLNQSLIGSMP
jgi:hypothetical protein